MDSGSVRAWDCCRAAQSDRHEWGIPPLKWLKWLRTVANSFISQQGDEGHAECAGVQKGKAPQCCCFFLLFFLMYCIHGVCAGEFQCHTQHNELQNGTGSGRWPRDAHRRATSFPLHIQPKIFTITLKATYILIWPSSNQRAGTKKKERRKKKLSFSNFSPVILSLCFILFYLFIFGPFYFKKAMWRAAVSAIKGGPPGSSGCD